MKSLTRVLILVLVLGLTITTDKVFAASISKDQAAAMDPKMEAMMAKFKEYSTPNENHKALDTLVGSWDYTLNWWMSPDKAPETSTGTSEIGWILNNHFIKQTVSGTSMGQPFEGLGLIGYNNIKKTYETIWLDNMATGMMMGKSQFDADKKVLSEKGDFTCPLVDGNRGYRTMTTLQDADHFTYEMYMNDVETGKEFKSMEIHYTKKK